MRCLPSSAGSGAFKSKKQENTIKLDTLLDSAILFAWVVSDNARKNIINTILLSILLLCSLLVCKIAKHVKKQRKHNKLDTFFDCVVFLDSAWICLAKCAILLDLASLGSQGALLEVTLASLRLPWDAGGLLYATLVWPRVKNGRPFLSTCGAFPIPAHKKWPRGCNFARFSLNMLGQACYFAQLSLDMVG